VLEVNKLITKMRTKDITKVALYSFVAVMIFTAMGPGIASADMGAGERGFRDGVRPSFGFDMNNLGLGNVHPDFKSSLKDLTPEERRAFREEKKAMMEEHRKELQDFLGITQAELKNLRDSGQSVGDVLLSHGKTETDAKAFLTDRANERVSAIVERLSLNSDEEKALRDRVDEMVSKILDRWFNRN